MIIIDPGHGGAHRGGCFNGIVEKDRTLALALDVERRCRLTRTPVALTRRADVTMTFPERYLVARAAGARGVVSIHFNGTTKNPDQRGSEAYHWPTNSVTRELGLYWQQLMPVELATRKVISATDLPTPDDDWLNRPRTVLKAYHALMVLLLEVGYMSNADDARWLNDPVVMSSTADAIHGTIVRFMEVLNG